MSEVPAVLQALRMRAASDPKRIVLSEGDDPRVIAAAISARDVGMAKISVVGDAAKVQALLNDAGDDGTGITIHDPATSPLTPDLETKLVELRGHKGMTPEQAAVQVQNRLVFAALLVRTGHADGTVGGAVETTGATVRAALQIIGKHKDAALVSSFFLMAFPEDHHSGADAMIFSDCGLVIDPSVTELSAIAEQAAASCAALLDRTPKIAMLSFSTKGSASHERVTKVTDALRDLQDRRPDLSADGELQFDTAIVPSVGAKKAPESTVAGHANVLVFPNLDAGNIGYKIAQRLGGAEAIGPVLQGLAQPANDLSRGCVAEDIVNIIAVTTAQAHALKANT